MRTRKEAKSPVCLALRELRNRAGFSQEALARELGVALQTATLWETKRPPSGIMLARLADFAADYGHADLKQVFEDALTKLPPAIGADIRRERERWADIYKSLETIQSAIDELGPRLSGSPAEDVLRSVDQECDDLRQLLIDAQARAWRNQR